MSEDLAVIFGNAALRGGQTALHGFRLWSQMLKVIAMIAAALAVAVPVWNDDLEAWADGKRAVMSRARVVKS